MATTQSLRNSTFDAPERPSGVSGLNTTLRPALMSFFLRRVHSFIEAEDLTQEVFLRLLQKSATLDAARPKGYAFQVAANLLRDRSRRGRVRSAYVRHLAIYDQARSEERHPARILEGKEELATVVAALTELPDRTRTTFLLSRQEGMKQRCIAETLGVSTRTVEQEVLRANRHLRQRLGESSD